MSYQAQVASPDKSKVFLASMLIRKRQTLWRDRDSTFQSKLHLSWPTHWRTMAGYTVDSHTNTPPLQLVCIGNHTRISFFVTRPPSVRPRPPHASPLLPHVHDLYPIKSLPAYPCSSMGSNLSRHSPRVLPPSQKATPICPGFTLHVAPYLCYGKALTSQIKNVHTWTTLPPPNHSVLLTLPLHTRNRPP